MTEEQVSRSVGWLCPACGAGMYPAKLLKGYDKTGPEADRPTCALHGPQGHFRHIATDRERGLMALVCNGGWVAGSDRYWYRGVVQYGDGPLGADPPLSYIVQTGETAAQAYVWEGNEQLRDDPEAVAYWVERRPMDCWERVPDEPPNPDAPAESSEASGRGQSDSPET